MPAIKSIVVLPNHIKKFIAAIKPLVGHTLSTKLNDSGNTPVSISNVVNPPVLENSCTNNIENAAAITKFGIYIIVLKNVVPLSFNLNEVNHNAINNETIT